MDTSERIVESYVRQVKRWATIANVRGPGQIEVDLLAVDPVKLERYHIEVSVSISKEFSKLTSAPFDPVKAKIPGQKPTQRRTLGYFAEEKFSPKAVRDTLSRYGFEEGNYHKVVVTWDQDEGVPEQARQAGIIVWEFPKLLEEMVESCQDTRQHFPDDIMRTLHLYAHAQRTLASRRGS